MWFGVDVLGDEPWKITVQEIQIDGNPLQTAVWRQQCRTEKEGYVSDNLVGRQAIQLSPFTSSPTGSNDGWAPSPTLCQIVETMHVSILVWFKWGVNKKWPHTSISRVEAMLIIEDGRTNGGSCSRKLPVPHDSALYKQ